VAALPVIGPLDVITDTRVGCLHEDLGTAVRTALALDRAACRAFAEQRSWNACARVFRSYLHEIDPALIGGGTPEISGAASTGDQCAPAPPR